MWLPRRCLPALPALIGALVLAIAACGPVVQPTIGSIDPLRSAAPAAPRVFAATAQALTGRLLFVQGGDLWIYENGSAHQLATGETWSQPAWSPDGTQFAYVLHGQNFSDIVISDPTGQHQTRLTRSQSSTLENNVWNQRPTWSPDGKQLAFITDRSSYFPTLWVMNVDGTGAHQMSMDGLSVESVDSIAWAPDGKHLAVTAFPGPGTTQVAIVPASANSRERGKMVTDYAHGAVDPAWSPDGRWLAYAARDAGGPAIFVAHADGSSPVRLTKGTDIDRAPTWSPDSNHLAYLSAKGSTVDVWVQDIQIDGNGVLSGSSERQLTQNLGLDGQSGITWAR